ncbi:MAG: TonB family protein [Terriglobales bacterium]
MRHVFVILIVCLASIALAAEDFKTIDEKEAAALAVNAPRPNYPYEARAHHLQGSGIAILTVDPATGNVTSVVMRASTGVSSLDDAAISTFRRWRFKPGIVTKVRVPINFALSGPGVSYVVGVVRAPDMDQVLAPFLGKGNVIKASLPRYPLPWTSKGGRGVYEIHVNKAGAVTEVKILKPSGDSTFDKVTLDTLNQWRLRHGPKIIELPLTFVMTPDNFLVRIL